MSDAKGASGAPQAASAASTNVSANATSTTTTTTAKAAPAAEGNPVFRMMGLPQFKRKLPSRNWMIFFGVTGSFAAAVIYDKHQTKRLRKKWCDLVSPIAEQQLAPNVLPRRISVYIEAPPADGLRSAREHFHEYVKPVLVAAAMDWDVVEGRREGDVRFGTADRIRKQRRRRGEGAGETQEEEEEDSKSVVEDLREQLGTPREAGPAGDLIIGRHTWKEYVRGLHEGWLGPVNKPVDVEQASQDQLAHDTPVSTHVPGQTSLGDAAVNAAASIAAPSSDGSAASTSDDASPAAAPVPEEPKKDEEDKPKRASKPDAYITTSAYASAQLPSSVPQDIGPVSVVPMPHILGFWNFPIRIWRFINRREVADDVGRRTAALVLASSRPFNGISEQEAALAHEEPEWHKSVRKRVRVEGQESVWLDDMVIDERIADRMRVFEVNQDDEARAEQLLKGSRNDTKDAE